MTEYKRNKIKTAWDIRRRIKNWPTAFGLRLRQKEKGLRLLHFRDGLNVVCRGGTRDWDVVHELLFAQGYGRALNYLAGLTDKPVVLDLGANIGLFSLLAASRNLNAEIYAYEPGPPNYRIFEMNRLANETLGERIHLRKEAVAGRTRQAEWTFDAENPGGSSLYGAAGSPFVAQIRAFAEVMETVGAPVALVKMDIEGAEYEVIANTPREVWQRVAAMSLELHDCPEGKVSQEDFLERMKSYGFKVEEERVCSFFLHR